MVSWKEVEKRNRITLWERVRLLFVRARSHWDHEEKIVTAFKVMDGKFYILKQEPMAYGDRRNDQISRFP